MTVSRWGALAGALVVLAGAGAPAPVSAQSSVSRAFELVGRGAHIGVTVEDLEGDDAKQRGVRIETVTPDGPADKAGLKAGDTISEFDGERVRSMLHFSRLVQETPPGRAVPVTLTRGGQRMNVTITPDRRSWPDDFGLRMLDVPRRVAPTPTPPAPPRAPRPPAMAVPEFFDGLGVLRYGGGRRLGITIEGIDNQFAEYFGVKEGVLVKSVEDGSAAQKAGIKAGDVITAINGSKVYDSSDVNRAINRLDDAGEFTAEIVREKKTQTVKGKVEGRVDRPRARTIL